MNDLVLLFYLSLYTSSGTKNRYLLPLKPGLVAPYVP